MLYSHAVLLLSSKKSLIPFVKNLVPFLCNRVDSKGITFESSASRGEFTLANQISSHSNSYYIFFFLFVRKVSDNSIVQHI